MFGRVLIGGIVAGCVAFAWGAAAHMVFQLGDGAFKEIPNEEFVVSVLRENVDKSAMYYFPGMPKLADNASAEEKTQSNEVWTERYKAGPAGLLVYTVSPGEPMETSHLLIQFLFDLGMGIIAAYMLSRAASDLWGYLERVLFVTLLGLFASLAVPLPYWNWYRFSTEFIQGAIIEQLAGAALMGIVLAAIIRRPKAPKFVPPVSA
jgi:hypothetical protein